MLDCPKVSTEVPQAKAVSGKSGAISSSRPPYWEPWAMTRS